MAGMSRIVHRCVHAAVCCSSTSRCNLTNILTIRNVCTRNFYAFLPVRTQLPKARFHLPVHYTVCICFFLLGPLTESLLGCEISVSTFFTFDHFNFICVQERFDAFTPLRGQLGVRKLRREICFVGGRS